jgi:hypothetical protein
MTFNGQAGQDAFVLWCLQGKRNGVFVEIGSNHPIEINNSYLLEKEYGWRGVMIEYQERYLPLYEEYRPKSAYRIKNAVTIDYVELFKELNFPKQLDYLQIDLEVSHGTTIQTLEKLKAAMDLGYTFGVVTFEHDIYDGDKYDTRARSRSIFESYGYLRVCSDVKNCGNAFEDWYIHPSIVDLSRRGLHIPYESMEWTDILKALKIL